LIDELALEGPLENGLAESSRSLVISRNDGFAIGCDRKTTFDLIYDPSLFG